MRPARTPDGGPVPERPLTWVGWRFAAAMYLVSVAAAACWSFVFPYLIGEPGRWVMSGDVWNLTNSAQYMVNGGAGALYAANPWFSALPGFLLLYAPVVALGQHLGLTVGYPLALARPTMWLLSGPFFFLVGSVAVLGVDYLADTLGTPVGRRRLLAVAMAVVVAAPSITLGGHPEDLLALALACVSLSLYFRGRLEAAALVLSAAILAQTWAGLLLPLLVAASPRGRRVSTCVRAALAPAVIGVALLALDWKDASLQLLRQPLTPLGQHLPWGGLSSTVVVRDFGQPMHLLAGSSTRSVAVLVALAGALWVAGRPTPERIILVASVALYFRGFVESDFWPYYFLPGAVMLAVHGAWLTTGSAKRFAVSLVGAFLLYGSAPMAYQNVSYSPWLALAVVVAAGLLSLLPALGAGGDRPAEAPASVLDGLDLAA